MPEKIVTVAEGMRRLNIKTDEDFDWLVAQGGIPKPQKVEGWSEFVFRQIEKVFERRYKGEIW